LPLLVGVGGTDGAFVTDRQLPTAPSPAAGQDVTAILRLHTRTKPVGLGAVTVIRLKCTLRHYSFLFLGVRHSLTPDAERPKLDYRAFKDERATVAVAGVSYT